MDQLIPTLAPLVDAFRDCFRAEVFRTFQTLISGWIVCVGPRTISEVWQATGLAAKRHHDTAYAVFRSACWEWDDLGLVQGQRVSMSLKCQDFRQERRVHQAADHLATEAVFDRMTLEEGDREALEPAEIVAQCGLPGATVVLAEVHVQYPVHRLDPPMTAHRLAESLAAEIQGLRIFKSVCMNYFGQVVVIPTTAESLGLEAGVARLLLLQQPDRQPPQQSQVLTAVACVVAALILAEHHIQHPVQ